MTAPKCGSRCSPSGSCGRREPALLERADEWPVVDVEGIGEHVRSGVAVEQDGVDVRTLSAAIGTRRREPGFEILALVEVRDRPADPARCDAHDDGDEEQEQ